MLDRDGVAIADVECRHPAGRGRASEHADRSALVFVRRGWFVRSVDGVVSVLDPTVAYCLRPGEEQRYDHPHADGDACTLLSLDPRLIASLWGGDPALPAGPLHTRPRIDLEHRLLLSAARRGVDPHELFEHALALTADTLAVADARRVGAGRPATVTARRALVDAVREALAVNPGHSLPELARVLAVSPHHLSRIFHAATGHTISRHRMRLRARAALERLADGERDLARLAADLGFADQGHLCRVVRNETGHIPSRLRQALT